MNQPTFYNNGHPAPAQTRQAWTKQDSTALAIFAAECALDAFEKMFPSDRRVRECIETAKRVLKEDTEETRAAAEQASHTLTHAERVEAIPPGDVSVVAWAAIAAVWTARAAGETQPAAALIDVSMVVWAVEGSLSGEEAKERFRELRQDFIAGRHHAPYRTGND